MYVLEIWASLCYEFRQFCFITNQGKRCYNLGKLHCYKLGQVLLQIGAAITNWGKMYCKLWQVLQIRAIITNWGITAFNIMQPWPLQELCEKYLRIFFEQLVLEFLQHRSCYRKLCYFYKILKGKSPNQLLDTIPLITRAYLKESKNNILYFKVKQNFFKIFFSLVNIEWNKPGPEIQNA